MWPVKWQVCPGAHAREGPQAAGRVVLTPATSQGGRLHRGLHQLWAPRLLCHGSEAVSGDGGVGGEGASEGKREVYSGHHGAGRDVLCLNDGAGVRPASQHSPPAARPRRVREGDGAAEPSASPVTHVHRGSGLELEATHPAPLVRAVRVSGTQSASLGPAICHNASHGTHNAPRNVNNVTMCHGTANLYLSQENQFFAKRKAD